MGITIAELQAHVAVDGLDSADRQFQGLNRTVSGAASGFSGLGNAVSTTSASVADLATRKAALLGQISSVTASLRSETTVLAGAQAAVTQLGGGHKALNTALLESQTKLAGYVQQQSALKTELASVNTAMRGATTAVNTHTTAAGGMERGIARLATAFIPLRPGVNQASAAITAMEGVSLLGATAALGLAAGVLAAGKAAYDAAAAFDDASDRIRIATGATGERLTALEGSFKTVFTSIPTTSQAASQAIAFLNQRLGETGPSLEKLATTELELARITGSALQPQLEATTRLFKDWEIVTNRQSESLDFLFRVSQKTGIGVTDLSQKLVQFGAPMRLLGFSFQEAAVMIGKFQAEGVELEKVLPGLRILLSKMASEGVTNAKDAFALLIEKITNTKTTMEGAKLAVEAFGRRAGADMAEAIKQGRFSIEELQKAVASNSDTIIKAGKDTEDFAEKWIILKNKASAAMEPVGRVVFDALTAVISSLTEQGAEIDKRWSKVWDDMNMNMFNQLKKLVDLFNNIGIANAAFAFGLRLADKIVAGFESGGIVGRIGLAISRVGGMITGVGGLMDWARGTPQMPGAGTTVPGLPGEDVLAAADKALRARGKATLDFLGGHNKGVKKALEDGFNIVSDWLRSVGNNIDISKKTWDSLGATVKNSLLQQAKAYTEDQVSVQRWGAVLLSVMGKVGQEVVKLANGHLLVRDSTIQLNSHMDAVAQKMEHAIIPISHVDAVSIKLEHTLLNLGPSAESVSTRVLDAFQEMGQQIPQTWNHIIDAIIIGNKPLTDAMLQMGIKVKGIFSDVFQVIGNLPGKIGDTLRKITSDFDRWVNTINGILSILHRIFNSIPESLSHVAASIANIFSTSHKTIQTSANLTQDEIQKTAKAASQGLDEVSESLQKSGDEAGGAAAKWIGAVGAVMGAIAAFAGTRGQGKLVGVLGGAAAGASIGALFGGLGAAIGAGIGALVGLLGSGKTAAQKQSEAAAIAAAKLSAEETGQRIIGTYFDNFGKALDFMSRVNEFEGVAKDKYRSFMRWFGKLLTGFVDTMKAFANENMVKAKEMAEAIGPIIQAIAAAPLAFDAINQHFGITESSIDRFFTSFDQVMNRFFARSEEWIGGVSKRAQKVADRLNPVVALISGFAGSLTSISTLTEPTDEMFAIFDRVIEKIVTHVEALSGKFDKAVLKTMANFAEKAGAALALWTTAIEAIKATVDIRAVTDADANNITAGIELFINKLGASLERLATADLGRIVAFAGTIIPIATAIKAWADTSAAIRGYTVIAAESWDAIVADFTKAIQLMGVLITQAMQFESMAITLEGILKSGAQHLNDGIEAMTAGVVGAAGALQDAFGHVQGGVGAQSTGGFAPMSSQPFKSGASSSSVTVNIGDVFLDGRRAPEQKQSLAAMVAELISSQSGQAQANRNNQPGVMDLVNFAKRTKFA